jgi:uncharacterized protein YukE
MVDFNSIKSKLSEHAGQVNQGLDKLGGVAKKRFAGHDEQIDQAVEKVKRALNNDTGGTGAGAPGEAHNPRPGE